MLACTRACLSAVSIPHWFDSHFCINLGYFQHNSVSIPHPEGPKDPLGGSLRDRCDSHIVVEYLVNKNNNSFNPSQVRFTQGHFTLYKVCFFKVSIPHRFDSHPYTSGGTSPVVNGFQSLTGSIHTCLKSVLVSSASLVSIPHRFDSHRM